MSGVDKQELRSLAESVLEHSWSPDVSMSTAEVVYACAASPAAVLELIAENERLKQFEDAYTVWIEKTEWVQATGKAIELGLHRADVLRLRIDRLQVEVEALRTCLTETGGVAVTMLYESHKADTLKEFNVEELTQMVDSPKHLSDANAQVEKIYRKAWDMAQGGTYRG